MAVNDSNSKFSVEQLSLIPLQKREDLMNDCAELLNSQWPRSKSARLRSLEQAHGDSSFPISLLLILESGTKNERLIGHSKILAVPYDKERCFIESVVIDKTFRRKGYGRVIMEKTEEFARSKGIKIAHLTTHDQQGFYSRLGYEFGDPIIVFGGCSANIQKLAQCIKPEGSSQLNERGGSTASDDVLISNSLNKLDLANTTSVPPSPPPPPPPLPVPPSGLEEAQSNNNLIHILHRPDGSVHYPKMHMRKILS